MDILFVSFKNCPHFTQSFKIKGGCYSIKAFYTFMLCFYDLVSWSYKEAVICRKKSDLTAEQQCPIITINSVDAEAEENFNFIHFVFIGLTSLY